MWLLIFIFILITVVIAWCFFLYFILLWFIGLFQSKKTLEIPSLLPTVALIVPCYNEEKQIIAKLENIRSLKYPENLLEVIFVDGGSSDKTVDLLSKAIREGEPCRIEQCDQPGKINQLNYGLAHSKGNIIVNTDVDTLLSAEALIWLAAEFSISEDVLVVGAYSRPADTIEIEKYYWSAQNKGRFIESDAMSSSIVIAPCYAFRRKLLNAFPADVVADDIYVAFLSHAYGGKTVYSRKAVALETRSPKSYAEFLPHKFRKSNAFIRESLRFLYLLPEMNFLYKIMFLTRLAQQLLLPWALLFWFLIAGTLLTMSRFDIVLFILVLFSILFIFTNRIFSWLKLPEEDHKLSLLVMVKGYLLTLIIMLATGISYPFFKQGSVYSRLKDNPQ